MPWWMVQELQQKLKARADAQVSTLHYLHYLHYLYSA